MFVWIPPLKADDFHKVNVRIIVATNRNLKDEIERGRFREDLYHRLEKFTIHLPCLRDCPEDIPNLIEHFLAKHTPDASLVPKVTPEAMQLLQGYHWPGNVREMDNEIERALILAGGEPVGAEHLSSSITGAQAGNETGPSISNKEGLRAQLRELHLDRFCDRQGREVLKAVLEEAVIEFGGLKKAAESLGLLRESRENEDYQSLRGWCVRLGISARKLAHTK